MQDPKIEMKNFHNLCLSNLDTENNSTLSSLKNAQIELNNQFDMDEDSNNFRKRAKNASISDYFKQDRKKTNHETGPEKEALLFKRYESLGETFSDFNFKGFVSSFIYHILYFGFLGPLIIPIISFIESYNYARNLEFASLSIFSIFQCWLYVSTLTSYIICYGIKQDELSLASAYTFGSSMIFRCFIISLKYALINKEKLNILKKYHIPIELRLNDQLIPNWTRQYPENIYIQLRESAKIYEIDDALFYFKLFKEDLHECPHQLLESNNFIIKRLIEDQIISSEIYIRKEIYHGLSFLYTMIQEYNKTLVAQKVIFVLISFVISVIFFLFPYYFDVESDFKLIFNPKWSQIDLYQTIGCIASAFPSIFFSTLDIYFLFILLIDTKRINSIMKKLTSMIIIRELQLTQQSSCSDPPLINFFDMVSLKTWSNIRRVAIGYGVNYRKRIEYAAVLFTLLSFFYGAYLLLDILFGQGNRYPILSVLVISKIVMFLIIFCVNFSVSAEINNSYLYQKAACQEIKNVVSFIKKFQSYYFEGRPKSDNYLVFVRKIQSEYTNYLKTCPGKSLQEFIEDLEETLKDVMYEIDFDINHNSFKVVGIKAEMNLYKRIILTIVSFALSSVVKFLIYNRQ